MSLDSTPIRTDSDGDAVIKLVGDTGTNQVKVNSSGELEIPLQEPLDVSSATVTVTDDGNLDINSLPEPLDVSDATVTVADNGSFSVSSLPEPLDVSDATVTVDDSGNFVVTSDIRVGSSDVSDTNPVPVKRVGEGSGTARTQFQETTGLAAQSSTTFNFAIANSTTGHVEYVNVSSEVAFKAEIQTFNGTSATTFATGYGEPGDEFVLNPENSRADGYSQSNTGSGEEFRVVVTNNGDSLGGASGDVACTFETEEV